MDVLMRCYNKVLFRGTDFAVRAVVCVYFAQLAFSLGSNLLLNPLANLINSVTERLQVISQPSLG